jgi:hypothetical protein
MDKCESKILGIAILMFFVMTAGYAQEIVYSGTDEPPFEKYKLNFRGKIARHKPTLRDIIFLDNNGEILLACLEGKTRAQLEATGIQCLASQLQLLTDWSLLTVDKDVYETAIPIYGKEKATILRNFVAIQAEVLTEDIRPNMIRLSDELNKINGRRSTFTVLFTYIMHKKLWEMFEEAGFTSKHELSTEEPFWSGVVRAIYPPPDIDLGNLGLYGSNHMLHVFNYSEGGETWPGVKKSPGMQLLFSMWRDAGDDLKVDDRELQKSLAPFNLLDREGRLTVPNIQKSSEDDLYEMSIEIAEKIFARIEECLTPKVMHDIFGVDDQEYAVTIFYYELRISLLKKLRHLDALKGSFFFQNPDATTAEFGNLVIIHETK